MIAIATYTFAKVVLAIVNLCKSKKVQVPVLITIRSISLTDALASIFSLQRSMLVSFGGMTAVNIDIFNTLTGVGVCLAVVVLGINLIKKG